jgi:hypothetical protein
LNDRGSPDYCPRTHDAVSNVESCGVTALSKAAKGDASGQELFVIEGHGLD